MSDPRLPPAQSRLEHTGAREHWGCFFCGREHPTGLRLAFHAEADGSVRARIRCGALFEGYRETVHGGVIAALLDSAMTNCLFARGVSAVTAELRVRYLARARPDRMLEAVARLARTRRPLYHLEAELVPGGVTVARAHARFLEPRAAADTGRPGPAVAPH
jgi:uncharacterized protein (TIGR00369 family)